MTEAKYTPGPWTPEFGEAYRVRAKQDGGQVAIMMNLKGRHGLAGRRTGDEVAANARLIAAAPELLEALLSAKNTLVAFKFQPGDANCWEPHDEENLALVDAAIAKATGN